jgi:flagellar hook protein FlgE
MLRSMFSGVSGLRLHQTRMDVIGNNIANVNTVAFKSSRVTFSELYSQTLRPASAPEPGGRGGTNPFQIGLGIGISSIDVMHINGSVQRTDRATDLAIEGDGFFVVEDQSGRYYTRAGNFDMDEQGNVVTSGGLKVLGWSYDPAIGSVSAAGQPSAINLANLMLPPKATESVEFFGNLDSRLPAGSQVSYTVSVYDSKGDTHAITYTFEKDVADNVWLYSTSSQEGLTITSGDTGVLVFDDNGRFVPPDMPGGSTVPALTLEVPGTADVVYQASFIADKFTYNAGETSIKTANVDGYSFGVLNGIAIDATGSIIGVYSNGQFRTEAVLALATFTNTGGLIKRGDNLFMESTNSGIPNIGTSGTDGRGSINPGALEMSNVDLAREFTDMIATQRGFQANSRIITASDELLQELVNLKR